MQFTNIDENPRGGERVRGRLAANTNETVVGGDSGGERGRLSSNTNETVVRLGEHAADGVGSR